MKALIEVITGFLGAGKTAFINSLISVTAVKGDKISIIQLEQGKTKINEEKNNDYTVRLAITDCDIDSLKKHIVNEIVVNKATSVIIEYNGTDKLDYLYSMLSSKELKNICKLNTLYYICDGPNCRFYIKNMGELLIPFIESSNLILINNCKFMKEEEISTVRELLESINLTAYILKVESNNDFKNVLNSSDLIDKGEIRKIKLALWKHIHNIRRR